MQTHPIVWTVLELNLSKIDGIGGGVWKFLLEKRVGVAKAKWRGGFIPKWVLPYYTEVFLEIPRNAA